MSSAKTTEEVIEVTATNIGGIDETTVELSPGVNVLSGENATNRTSFLQALMAAAGSENVSLKGDADEGSVEMYYNGERYVRRLTRANDAVVFEGDPYSSDPELADLFGFLLQPNEARQAVIRGDDLREIIMQPVDTDQIQEAIEDRKAARRRIDEQLESIESAKNRLPELERRRQGLTDEIEAEQDALGDLEERIESADADVEQRREQEDELNEKLDALNEVRSDLENVRFRLETERESLNAVGEQREQLSEEWESLPEDPSDEIEEIERRIEQLRERKRTLDTVTGELQNVIQFNEEMLEGEDGLLELLREDDSDEAVTDTLLSDDERRTCWACGTEVEQSRLKGTVERLREVSREQRAERSDVADRLDELESERRDLEQDRTRRREVDRRLDELETEAADRETRIEELEAERAELEDRIEELQETVEELETRDNSQLLELHREANEAEFEIGQLTSDLEEVEAEIGELEEQIAEEEDLRERREEIGDELETLRTKIDRLERDAVEQFNEHMDEILDLLGYENIERVWIERTERETREGRRKVTRSAFDLHVIRQSPSGTTYEDTLDHLSESEREVIGLVFGLAGYLVHEVYEAEPFMLLDSLEAIDSDRIARLVDYFADYAPTIVVALLREDAQALDSAYRRVTDI